MSNCHDYSLIRLTDDYRNSIIRHIEDLSDDDKYLRFGYAAKYSHIDQYVSSSLISKDNFWWGIFDESKLIATIHVAIKDDVAEFAFSTDAGYRGQKLGQLLFARGYQLVTEFKITRIYMCCLRKNAAMRHIAKKFGLSVMTNGPDAGSLVYLS